jgi:hypothetical protein
MSTIRQALEGVANVLSGHGQKSESYVRQCIDKDAQLVANDINLWGGAGSLMDSALAGEGREIQRRFEAAVIELVHTLQRSGANSTWMEKWASVFEEWRRQNV